MVIAANMIVTTGRLPISDPPLWICSLITISLRCVMGLIVYTLLVAGVVFQLEKKSMDQKEDSNEEGEAESVGRSSKFKVSFDHALIEKVF